MNFIDLERRLGGQKKHRLAVLGAHDRHVLSAVLRAERNNIAQPVLIGNRKTTCKENEEIGAPIDQWEFLEANDDESIVNLAMALVRDKSVDVLMKGTVPTPKLISLGLSNGLKKEGRLLSHLAFLESDRLERFVVLTDSAIIPFPSLTQRIAIIKNAVETLKKLGIEQPKVALLGPSELVNEAIPCSVEAASLTEMNQKGKPLEGMGVLAGPMDLWSAIHIESARKKNIENPVAGHADVICCPDVISGNMLGKAASFFSSHLKVGGVAVGGTLPVCLLSRAASVDDKYYSILVGLSCVRD